MPAGHFRHVITIQQPVTTQDSYGAQSKSFVTFCTTRAQYLPVTGREMFTREMVAEQVECRFKIRYRAGIDSSFQVIWNGGTYQLMYDPIDEDGTKSEAILYCKKVN